MLESATKWAVENPSVGFQIAGGIVTVGLLIALVKLVVLPVWRAGSVVMRSALLQAFIGIGLIGIGAGGCNERAARMPCLSGLSPAEVSSVMREEVETASAVTRPLYFTPIIMCGLGLLAIGVGRKILILRDDDQPPGKATRPYG